jgi:hypothetical protein
VGGSIGIVGEEHRGPGGGIGAIDPGVGADEPVLGAGDHEIPATPQHLHCLLEHQLPIGGFLLADEGDDCSFGLGDDLVGDHEDVPRLRGQAGAAQGGEQQRRKVVAGGNLGDPG